MEEILASIRRIISEDGSPPAPQATAAEPTAPPAAEQPVAAPGQAVPPPAPIPPAAASAPAPQPTQPAIPTTSAWGIPGNQPATAGKELVLTQMLAEDGSVVALDRPNRDAGAAAVPGRPVEPSKLQPLDVLLLTDALPTSFPAAQAAVMARTPSAPPPPKVKDQVSHASPERAVQSNPTPSQPDRNRTGEGDPTLEEFVRQSLEPKIQEWLNANLKDIVERLVQEEIERISRRTE